MASCFCSDSPSCSERGVVDDVETKTLAAPRFGLVAGLAPARCSDAGLLRAARPCC
jgi:hypothetical protein